ncbi:MAG: transketolase [Dysgonamonadaceae bacterium]|jgi:transketolase|nr:transketolase [Dysgonamonadaceae bacterium]
MRSAFIQQLLEEAKNNNRIFLLVGDLGYSVVESFAEHFPDRFLNVGVAEQNMASIAAGLAKEGFIPFIYSIGNFPTLRCMEQIRYDICYHELAVKIIAVGGGYAYGSLGASHHTTEELGMLRTIPNMTVCAPADPIEAKELVKLAIQDNSPYYIRLSKNGEPILHSNFEIQNSEFRIKKGYPLLLHSLNSSNSAIFTTGVIAADALKFVAENSRNAAIYTFPFVKPIDRQALLPLFEKYENIITLEEHQASGGFGSAILECMNDLEETGQLRMHPKLKRVAIPDSFTHIAGSQAFLKKMNGLNLPLE